MRNSFINQIFEKLNLKEANKSKAEVDMDIFLEKTKEFILNDNK